MQSFQKQPHQQQTLKVFVLVSFANSSTSPFSRVLQLLSPGHHHPVQNSSTHFIPLSHKVDCFLHRAAPQSYRLLPVDECHLQVHTDSRPGNAFYRRALFSFRLSPKRTHTQTHQTRSVARRTFLIRTQTRPIHFHSSPVLLRRVTFFASQVPTLIS